MCNMSLCVSCWVHIIIIIQWCDRLAKAQILMVKWGKGWTGEWQFRKMRVRPLAWHSPTQNKNLLVFSAVWTDQWICLLQIEQLDIPAVAAQRSFLWIWCGNTEGLERGRLVGPVHMWLTVTLASCWSLLQQKHFLTSLDVCVELEVIIL